MDLADIERAPRSTLLQKLQEQNDLIQRREKRLRDIISAYKSVTKEKEALESSIKALSRSKAAGRATSQGADSETGSEPAGDTDRESDDGSGTGKVLQDPLNISGSNSNKQETDCDGAPEAEQLQNQVETLSSSLLTLSEEKSKVEANYIAEKKTLKHEAEGLQKRNKELSEKVEGFEKEIKQHTSEWKNRVRSQQLEREKEQTDHAVMLRELQKVVATERQQKELIEQQLDESQFRLREQERLVQELISSNERDVSKLREQIGALQDQVRITEQKGQEPSPQLLNLQRETAELKVKHAEIVEQDLSKIQDAEEKARVYGQQCESRISELEAKLSELSESVGNYERLRYQDQQIIQRLKERVGQLDQENTALVEASRAGGSIKEENEEEVEEVSVLVERLLKLKSQLQTANSKTDKPINIQDLLLDDEEEHPLCKKYREELEQLKDEYERYKLRAQSVLKNKKESGSSKDEDILKEHVSELRDRLRNLHIQQEEELEVARQREENLRKTLVMVQEKHKNEMSQCQAEHHTQLQELEEEIKKQRDRTVSMLAEKERELETLRTTSGQQIHSDYVIRYRSSQDIAGASSERQTSEEEAVTRLLTTPPSGQGEMTLLYFAQEQARKDVDITALRKQKRDLEVALRELQVSTGTKQEQHVDEIDQLREEIRKMERNINREGANLEYLKNVTYKFLLCQDYTGKQQMLNAITTILQFSPQEKASVQAQYKGWWSSTTS